MYVLPHKLGGQGPPASCLECCSKVLKSLFECAWEFIMQIHPFNHYNICGLWSKRWARSARQWPETQWANQQCILDIDTGLSPGKNWMGFVICPSSRSNTIHPGSWWLRDLTAPGNLYAWCYKAGILCKLVTISIFLIWVIQTFCGVQLYHTMGM